MNTLCNDCCSLSTSTRNYARGVNPIWLKTTSRFDLVATYIYARDRMFGRHPKWGLRLYVLLRTSRLSTAALRKLTRHRRQRLRCLTSYWHAFVDILNCRRANGPKTAPHYFIPVAPTAFENPENTHSDFGDSTRGVAELHGGISVVDGAHCLAASAIFGRPVLAGVSVHRMAIHNIAPGRRGCFARMLRTAAAAALASCRGPAACASCAGDTFGRRQST